MKRIAINGFGRIGRLALRVISNYKDMEVVAINGRSEPEEYAYLFKYDTVHRKYEGNVTYDEDSITVDGKKIMVYKEDDPSNLPWSKLNIDIVLECTGAFTKYEDAYKHIEAGAKKVLISAPGKGNMKTIVYNVNDNILEDSDIIVSAASCTTNCLAPVLKVLEDNIGIVKGNMTTVHAYTNDQATLDVNHKKGISERRGRACAMNIIPTSTGAASAISKVIPSLDGKLMGSALRVPVSDGSMIDLTLELKRNVTVEEVNQLFIDNSNETLKVTNDPVVSSDIISSNCGGMVDLSLTDIVESEGSVLLKVIAWYDNEMGYTHQMIRTLNKM